MTVYLVTFFLSYILCAWGEKLIQKKSYIKLAKVLLALSVLVVAIMAGLRDTKVGSDTIAYTTYYIEYGSRFHTLKDFMSFFMVYEPGFNVFSYIVGIVFNHNSNWFLFLCAIVIYGFTMKTFYYYRNNCSISMAWLFFLMINCTEALNITRHYMALAIAAFAFCFVYEKDIKKFTIFTILAMTFHVSAAVNFLLYFVYKGLRQFHTIGYKIAVVTGTVTLSFLYTYIFRLLSAFSFIGIKTEKYTEFASFSIQWNPLLIRIPFLLLIILHKYSFCNSHLIKENGTIDKEDVFGDFCFLVIIIELVLSQLRGFDETLYRITAFIAILKYVSYSRVLNLSRVQLNRFVSHIIAYIYIIIVFIYWVGILNSANIYPYASKILGL